MKNKIMLFCALLGFFAFFVPHAALADTTVNTFEELKQAFTSASGTDENPVEITVSGEIEVTEPLTLADQANKHIILTGGTLTCDESLNGSMITVYSGNSITLENITLDGDGHSGGYLINLLAGKVTLGKGAVLQNNDNTAVYVSGRGANFTMNDGEIKNNSDTSSSGCGGAIYINGAMDYVPSVTINGGTISGNTAGRDGGAIYAWSSSSLTVTGGEISNNSAGRNGGGICIDKSATNDDAVDAFSDGTIQNNTAELNGDNIWTDRNIEVSGNLSVPSSIYLDDVGDARLVVGAPLTGTIRLDAFEDNRETLLTSGRIVAEMKEGVTVPENLLDHLLIDEQQSLIIDSNGNVRTANPTSGNYPLNFCYEDTDTPIDSQSGAGWTWDKDTLTLHITGDVVINTTKENYIGVNLPANAKIVIDAGKKLEVQTVNNAAINSDGEMSISSNGDGETQGIVSTISGSIGISARNLTINNTTVRMTGKTNDQNAYTDTVGILCIGTLTIKNSDVSCQTDAQNNYTIANGIDAYRTVDIEDTHLELPCSTGIILDSSNSDYQVKLTRTTGFIGIENNDDGYAIEVALDSLDDSADGRVVINERSDLNHFYKYSYVLEGYYTVYYAVLANEDLVPLSYINLERTVENITLNPTSMALEVNDTFILSAQLSPTDVESQKINWTVDDDSIVSIKENDEKSITVTAMGEGTATITAEVNEITATCTVSVSAPESEPPYTGDYNYPVIVKDSDHGTVTIAKEDQWANDGETIIVTVIPDDAYILDTLVITDKAGKKLDVTDNGDGTYSFTMPESAVTITATFAENPDWIEPEPDPEPSTDVTDLFTDLAPDAWYIDAVQYAYDQGLMTGTSATTFEPNTSTTRAMIVAILHRLEGGTTADGGTFTDVADGDWYAEAVNWAASVGIVAGFEDGTFRPNEPITREQMAAILYNYAQWKGYDVSNRADLSRYSDQPSEWANEVMQWAVGEGLISGTSATTLDPQGHATRAQVASILQRFLTKA